MSQIATTYAQALYDLAKEDTLLLHWISLGLLLFLPFLSVEYLLQQFLGNEDF